MSNPRFKQPVFLNVEPAHLSEDVVESRLGRLRRAGKLAQEAVHSAVEEDRERRHALAESVTDREMRESLRMFIDRE